MPAREIDVRLRLLNGRAFRAEMGAAGKSIKKFGDDSLSTGKRVSSLGRGMRQVGGAFTRQISLPAAGAALAVSKFASDFGGEMTLIQTQAGRSAADVRAFSDFILNKMPKSAQGPMQLSQAMFHLASMNAKQLNTQKDLQESLKVSSDLAAVGHANVEDVARTLSAAYLTQIPTVAGKAQRGIKGFTDIAAYMNAAVGAGNVRLDEMSHALGGAGILPVAKAAGLRLDDILGVMALLTDEGFDASSAMRLMRTSLSFITSPTEKSKKAMDKLGLGAHQLANDLHRPKGLLVAMKDLRGALSKLPGGFGGARAQELLGHILPAGRGVPLRVLLNQLDNYQRKYEQINRLHGKFGADIKKTQETPWFKAKNAWAEAQKAFVRLGQALQPVFVTLVNFGKDVANWFLKLPKPVQQAIAWFILFLAVLGPLIIFLGMLVTAIGVLIPVFVAIGGFIAGLSLVTLGWILVIVAVIAGIVLLYMKCEWFRNAVQAVWSWVKKAAAAFWHWATTSKLVSNAIKLVWNWIKIVTTPLRFMIWLWWQWIKVLYRWVQGPARLVIKTIGSIASHIWGMAKDVGRAAAHLWEGFKGPLISVLNWCIDRINWMIRAFNNTAGRIPGVSNLDQLAHISRGGGGRKRGTRVSTSGGRSFNVLAAGARGWGGTVSSTASYLTGERGPELIDLPAGARVQPLTPAIASAFSAARPSSGGGANFHLYIDGQQINAAVTRVERRKAARR